MRGHQVTLFDAAGEIGGQFNVARQIPGKAEFNETLRYYRTQLARYEVDLRLNCRVAADMLGDFDEIVLATGIVPRTPDIAGITHRKVLSYLDVLRDKKPVGQRVAIIGAGGIGFDTASYLSHSDRDDSLDIAAFCQQWGIDQSLQRRGGLAQPQSPTSPRQIWLLQRKAGKPGAGLGKTTGWIHRSSLQARGVEMWGNVQYLRVDDDGLHILRGGSPITLPVDNVIICAGQEPNRALAAALAPLGTPLHIIGGADVALELDARRAIKQGTALALTL